jgi:hypothetical protein
MYIKGKGSSSLSLTTVLDGGGWSVPHPGHFTPRKDLVPFVQEAVWDPGSVWTGVEYVSPPGFIPQTFQPIASRYTDRAIPYLI